MDRVPDRVKSFYRVNNVRKFRYDRPFHKGPKDKENEFKVNNSGKAGAVLREGQGQAPLSQDLLTVSSFRQAGVAQIAHRPVPACVLLTEPVD